MGRERRRKGCPVRAVSAAVSILPVAGRTRVSRFHGARSGGGGGGRRDADGLAALPGRRVAG